MGALGAGYRGHEFRVLTSTKSYHIFTIATDNTITFGMCVCDCLHIAIYKLI